MSSPPTERLCSQTLVERFDAVFSVVVGRRGHGREGEGTKKNETLAESQCGRRSFGKADWRGVKAGRTREGPEAVLPEALKKPHFARCVGQVEGLRAGCGTPRESGYSKKVYFFLEYLWFLYKFT